MTTSAFTISAIIPTRNRADRVVRAIESVLAQTVPVDEIIIVDDGSEDNTREAVAAFGPALRYIYQEGKGVAAARNAGVQAAQSEWIAFLDDDDEWYPDRIEAQILALSAQPGVDGCYAPAFTVCDLGGPSEIHYPVPPARLEQDILLRNPFTQCSVVMRKSSFEQLGGFNTALRCGEDWEFCFRAVRQGLKFVMVDRPLVKVHESPNSSSKNPEAALASERRVVDLLVSHLRGPMRLVWQGRMNSRMYYRAALSAKARNLRHAHYLVRSILYWPSPLFDNRRFKTLAIHIAGAFGSVMAGRRKHA
jgi:glycosyltransferase involved in cell wall biosynthesis